MTHTILVDNKTLQIFSHFEEFKRTRTKIRTKMKESNPAFKKRLNKFFEILEDINSDTKNNIIIDKITKENLKNSDCLIILTRIKAFSDDEINLILNFINKMGKNLLLMSNHNPLELNDNDLTRKLGVTLSGGYWGGKAKEFTTIDNEYLSNHTIIRGKGEEKSISSVVVNTTCRIISNIGEPFIFLPNTMEGGWSSENEELIKNKVFGLVIDGEYYNNEIIKGRVVILADSGFIGDKDSIFPGFGLIDKGDNILFLQRILQYLLN